jgi:phosphoribosylformylglycinamidine (FGAM) synthase-like amidotransferase family enzyme
MSNYVKLMGAWAMLVYQVDLQTTAVAGIVAFGTFSAADICDHILAFRYLMHKIIVHYNTKPALVNVQDTGNAI